MKSKDSIVGKFKKKFQNELNFQNKQQAASKNQMELLLHMR